MSLFSKSEERKIIKEAEKKAIEEKKKQDEINRQNEIKRKEKDYRRKKVEYDARNWEFASNQDGFGRYSYFLVKYALSIQQKMGFDMKANVKYFKLEKMKEYLDELLPKGEKPPVK